MGLEVVGLEETLLMLRRTEDITNKVRLRNLRKAGLEIRDLAREYAPVDEGYLEEAIVVAESQERYAGRSRKTELIGVDPDKLGPGYTSNGYRYDIAMHEGFVKGKPYKLGPKSLAKQAATGKQVGPKYLERAATDLRGKVQEDFENDLRDALRGLS